MTEDHFLEALFAAMPPPSADVTIPVGDDCAAFDPGNGSWILIAVDQLVGDKHYLLQGNDPTDPSLAGRKLLGRNLSDIAAMGGTPRFCLVAAAFGPACNDSWMTRFHAGITSLARDFQVSVIGGDLALAPNDTVSSLTIVGEVPPDEVVLRKGASPGDDLWVTGVFGRSFLTGHHLTFTPRCAEGRWLARNGFARAMIDVSDGLVLDTYRLCRASNIGCRIDVEAVPRRTVDTTVDEALGDGEDYELIVAVGADRREDLLAAWPFNTPLTRIGRCDPLTATPVRNRDDTPIQPAGWDHFSHGAGDAS